VLKLLKMIFYPYDNIAQKNRRFKEE